MGTKKGQRRKTARRAYEKKPKSTPYERWQSREIDLGAFNEYDVYRC